ncbi:MAG: transglutaminase domain-containing protein [Spirochaetales bacterium]|nr:transglutaminase domain-containing protein [Spirochaetales bacterium]
MNNLLDYYSQPGAITSLEKYSGFTKWLAADPEAIYQVVQGLMIHEMWLDRYGIEYKGENAYPQKTAYMQDILDKALELDGSSLAIPRAPDKRVIACCREFATLMCALLRSKGIPARSRCGFAVYFGWTGEFEDHWCCEYWNGRNWVMADPQLDPLQQSFVLQWASENEKQSMKYKENIKRFNPRDLSGEDFYTAGRVWKLCRENKLDAMKCGISCPIRPEWGINSLYGLWFVRGNLLRDFAALNKVETVPYLVRISRGLDWTAWRLVSATDDELTTDDWALLDEIAELTIDADDGKIHDLNSSIRDLAVPDEIIQR